MLIFKLKTSDETVVNAYKTGRNILRIDHLIQYENVVSIGAPVLLLFGGDGTPWTNGLYAIAKIASRPIDLGYEVARNGQYYKLDIEVVLRLNPIFEKKDFIKYPESFDSGVAPSTKGERNQALGIIDDGTPKTIASICRALLDSKRDYEPQLRALFGDRIIDYALDYSIVFTEVKNQSNLQQDEIIAGPKNNTEIKSEQVIYYGVPGCGKSHAVDKIINEAIAEFNKDKNAENQITYEKQVIRTVFHPDYCYADFVGQIMPKKERDGGIKYEFKPGPLANIIRKAYLNPTKPYFLIIEEINRGNASAIFGETFQLLDRYKNGKHSSEEEIRNENYDYTEGWSKYSINNDDLNGFILLGGESDITEKESGVVYESDSSETPKSAIKIPSRNLHFSTYSGVRLPPNLSLYATMNTSDQNVFTLDNAFQRRWEMKQVSNKLKNDKAHSDENAQYDQIIGNTDVKWGDFREKINEIIMQSAEENGLSSMEDKRLGGWFITPKKAVDADKDALPEITTQAFAEKVLKYLWDDAFKFDRKSHFADGDKSFKTLEDLIDSFKEKGFKVFKNETIKDLQVKTSLKSPTESDGDVNSNGQSNT